jgi:hypothetical protein
MYKLTLRNVSPSALSDLNLLLEEKNVQLKIQPLNINNSVLVIKGNDIGTMTWLHGVVSDCVECTVSAVHR